MSVSYRGAMLDLEQLINARFPDLAEKRPRLARPVLTLLKRLAREDDANAFLAATAGCEGFDFVDRALDYFNISCSVRDRELENIPAEGRVVIVANHPLGVLDGVALLRLVGRVRRDVKIVANDLLMHFRPIRPLLLPVVNLGEGSNRANVEAIHAALERDEAVIIFPSGEVSRAGPRGIRDGRWRGGFLRFAEQARAPVLPVHVGARNSVLFYGVSTLFRPLSTVMLLREPHQSRGATLEVRIGEPIPWKAIEAIAGPREEKIATVNRTVYEIGKRRPAAAPSRRTAGLATEKPVAPPEDRLALRRELRHAERLGETADGKSIYLVEGAAESAVLRELGRLREIAFRQVGEGTGRRRDVDAYDAFYRHVLLWDEEELQVAGAYRIGDAARIVAERGPEGLYTHTLFTFEDGIRAHFAHSMELGRSFVQPRYQGLRALDSLWQGIGAYLARHPHVRYLFGPVSVSNAYPEWARHMLVHFYRRHFGLPERLVTPRRPFIVPEAVEAELARLLPGRDYAGDFRTLKARFSAARLSVPTLYKQYAELCEPGGTRFLGFNVDPAFADCVDGLVMVDLLRMKPGKRERYLGTLPAAEAALLKSA